MKIKIKEGFLLRKVAGDHVVVPVGEAGKVFHGMIRLNEIRRIFVGTVPKGNDEGTGFTGNGRKIRS